MYYIDSLGLIFVHLAENFPIFFTCSIAAENIGGQSKFACYDRIRSESISEFLLRNFSILIQIDNMKVIDHITRRTQHAPAHWAGYEP